MEEVEWDTDRTRACGPVDLGPTGERNVWQVASAAAVESSPQRLHSYWVHFTKHELILVERVVTNSS